MRNVRVTTVRGAVFVFLWSTGDLEIVEVNDRNEREDCAGQNKETSQKPAWVSRNLLTWGQEHSPEPAVV